MGDLISRAALFNALATAQDKADIFAAIQAAPAVDVCLKCGKYRESYLGACNGCRWQEEEEIEE